MFVLSEVDPDGHDMKARLDELTYDAVEEWVICDNRFCDMWKETVKIVRICPSNETKIENKNKNCLKYAEKAHLNNCIDYTKIRYHCVLNSHGNQTIEVCAPEKRINGFCAEFNEEAGEILPNHYLDCSLFTPPCRSHYNSPDAYLCTYNLPHYLYFIICDTRTYI
ncbi:uncharacterized protein LOC133177280 [Saccostrea echinata]|uniref:uncharacterized protein LOC133177280 n=1 Tax=Saccostrea echinata TaxID=191078 RepID=UPI002A7F5C73|nr:uncharacterized protein LOC133177280 [Saccostrea echinata]